MECPACGREIDPLRAGEVAFVGGRFVYFCDRDHKAQWLASQASIARDDVKTAEPPPVAIEEKENDAISAEDPAPSAPRAHAVATIESAPDEEPRSIPIRRWATPDDAPTSLRAPKSRAAPAHGARGASMTTVLAYSGVAFGALAASVGLVGPSAELARLPLALAACACALVFAIAARPKLLGRNPWTASIALAMGAVCATIARGASATAIASFVGVASAAFIAVVQAMARAAEPVLAARAGICSALGADEATELRAGEQVTASAGETIPVDGIVASGEAVVSPWLDADADVTKREGSPVVAGARVISGSLRLTATWTGRDRAFVKMLAAPRAFDRAPLLHLASLLDDRATFGVAIFAAVVAFTNGASIVDSITCAAAALTAFATPTSSFAVALLHARGHRRALERGIVHRDVLHFDRAGRAQIAVVCARGTVLLGEPEIVAIEAVGSGEAEHVIALACAVANGSAHPFATAILRAARARKVTPEQVRNASHSGSGATAIDAHGDRIVLGRRVFLLAEKVSVAIADDAVREHESQGRSVLLVARGGKVVGIVALQDGLRAGARAAVQKLHDARIEPVLLSGEARETCEALARALDIEHLRPEIDGPDRGAEVKALGEGGDVVAVLGHPSADDSALGAADVSVALDSAGSSPGEWSVALASDDVRAAAEALTIPRDVRERSMRAMAVVLTPGVLVSLALAFQLVPVWIVPLASAVAASIALLYAKE